MHFKSYRKLKLYVFLLIFVFRLCTVHYGVQRIPHVFIHVMSSYVIMLRSFSSVEGRRSVSLEALIQVLLS